MRDPVFYDVFRDVELRQCLLQQHQAPTKLAPHDGVPLVRLLDRSTRIHDVRTEVLRGELVLQLLEAILAHAGEEKADHGVCNDAVDEAINDGTEHRLAPELLEQTGWHALYLHALSQVSSFFASYTFSGIFAGGIQELRLLPLHLCAGVVAGFGQSVPEVDAGGGRARVQ